MFDSHNVFLLLFLASLLLFLCSISSLLTTTEAVVVEHPKNVQESPVGASMGY